MKIAVYFTSITTRIFAKLSALSETSIKIKITSNWTLFVILLTSAGVCKQMNRNEIVQHLQN